MENEVYKPYGKLEPKFRPDPKKREGNRQKSKTESMKKVSFLAPWEEIEVFF
jgi:hypothetical protein